MFINHYNDLQRYRISLSCIMALLFALWMSATAVSSSEGVINLASMPRVEPKISFEQYFQVELIGLDRIQPLAEDRAMVGGVDLELYTAIQQASPGLFDLVSLDAERSKITMEFAIPEHIQDKEVDQFVSYQALNYAKLIHRLLPTAEIRNMHAKAFRRGVTIDYVEYDYWFDLPTLIGLESLALRKAYKRLGPQSKRQLRVIKNR